MAYFAENSLPRFQADDLTGTVRRLYSFCQELQETLQFVLSNLDGDNIEGYHEIFNRLEGADGSISTLKQTADEISAQVRNGSQALGELSVRADQISARVQDAEKGVSELKITANSISQRVGDHDGNISSLQQTASGLTSRVSSAEGNLSSLQQTASGLASRVSSAEGDLSSLQQTARGLAARITSAEGDLSSINLTAKGIAARVTSAEGDLAALNLTANSLSSRISNAEGSISTVRQTASGLVSTVSDLSGRYSELQQTVDGFDFTGMVTFTDLRRSGSSTINGDNITTGTVALDRLELNNEYGYIEMGEGSTGLFNTEGILICGPRARNISGGGLAPSRYRNHFFASDSGARITGEDAFGSESIYVCSNDINASISPANWSDERLKQDISFDIAERYGDFFRALRPARYRMNNNRSGRFHTGFIAQQMRDALAAGGLTRQDFAALVQQDYNPQAEDGGGGRYSIRYGELAALNTAMIQALLARVDALEHKIEQMKGDA